MKTLAFLTILYAFIFGFLWLISPADAAILQEDFPPPPASEQDKFGTGNEQAPPYDFKADSGAALGTLSNIIDFTDNSTSEWHPAVAYNVPDRFLVVFEQNGDIYGQSLNLSGNMIGTEFLISNGLGKCSNPDVAIGLFSDIFVVTWQYDFYGDGRDYDIRARGMSPAGDFLGDEIIVAQTDFDERNPAIACNSDDNNCFIVYDSKETGNRDIYGIRILLSNGQIATPTNRINISQAFESYNTVADERNPDVVWGGSLDEYMLVWEYDFGDRYQIVHAAVHDTHQQYGNQYKPGLYQIYNHSGNQSNSAVAFSCRSNEYLVVFQNRYQGTELVVGKRLGLGSEFRLRTELDIDQLYPAVAYSNGPDNYPEGEGEDQFLVTYVLEGLSNTELIGQAVKGAYVEGNPQKDGSPVTLFSTLSGQNFGIGTSNITGTVNNGKYFVVWDKYSGGFAGFNYDILGRMVSPEKPTFQLSVTKGGSGSGVVTSTPAGINCGATCSASFENGTSVTLTATADAGSTFAGWSGACSGTNTTCVVSMTQARAVTATFSTTAPNTVLLTVTLGGSGEGVVTSSPAGINCGNTCTASFANGSTVTLTAAPGSNTNFNGWGGDCVGYNTTCVLTMTQAKSVVAYFNYTVTPNTNQYLPLIFR